MSQAARSEPEFLDFRALSDTQWAELRARLERRARQERSETMLALFGQAFGWLRRKLMRVAAIADLWAGHVTRAATLWLRARRLRRHRRLAVAQLNALNDRDLWDIGLRRCEIASVVYRHDPTRIR